MLRGSKYVVLKDYSNQVIYICALAQPTGVSCWLALENLKRKVDTECRVFNKTWTSKYLFTEVKVKAVFLVLENRSLC